MEQNASSIQPPAYDIRLPLPPKTPRRKFPFWLYVIIFVSITSVLASSLYFFYRKKFITNSDSERELPADSVGNDSWDKYIYEDAAISFYHPKGLTALTVPSGLSISQNGEIIMEIKHGKLDEESLADFVSKTTSSIPDVVQINNKIGLSINNGDINYRYFPEFLDNYVVLEIHNGDPETNELIESIVQTIEFLPPNTASNSI